MISRKLAAAVFVLALAVPTAALATTMAMDCCKDCACCKDKPAETPAPAPEG